MRILSVTPELPYEPGGGGGRTHEYFLCRRLVELGHEVRNVSPVLPMELDKAQILADAGAENWVTVRPSSPLREVAEAVAREPQVLATALTAPVRALEMRVFWTRLRRYVARSVAEFEPDVAMIFHDMAAGWSVGLPSDLPAVLVLQNLTWHWYLSRAARSHGLQALLLRAEAARYRRFLLTRLARFDAAVAVSTVEAAELRLAGSVPVSVISTGLDTRETTPAPEQDGPPRLVFTGTLGYQPNSQGIEWFADRVWPEIRRRVPAAQLEIVGREPTRRVLALDERAGISVVGPVPEMAPYFARAHVVVVPILTGAGVRVKIVEAMAAGRAVVSTSRGWEGLPHVEPGRHLLVADEPAAFAEATVSLLTDPGTRRRLAADGRELAERHYDWRALGDEQAAVLAGAVARRRAARD